ncbi:MAG: phosphoribosylformylglycinamidine cyclo-ligase [Oscillospiraceae bacterium]|nr:phosphoribosylformylglycinamidine cyclo-ligase [Oscillospiraceae bacterium]
MLDSKSEAYAMAGVDITAGYESVKRIMPHIDSTRRQGTLGGFGGFGGLFEPHLSEMKRPIAVSGTDGVGTKLKIAFLMDKHDTIGIDCVAMCVNDIVCSGAEPVFFLDYIAIGKNIPERVESIVAGVAYGCRDAGCALIGGETAEHPGIMPDNEYDIAGFSVGFVDYDQIIDGSEITPGDVLIGLASSGLHSNGFSLVRKVFADNLHDLGAYVPDLGCALGEELLRPTRIYVKPLLRLIKKFGKGIKGICHITGGGHFENIPRMLPKGVRARVEASMFPKAPIFDMISQKGAISTHDMYNTFNMGIGFVIAVSESQADSITSFFHEQGETPSYIGYCVKNDKGVDIVW